MWSHFFSLLHQSGKDFLSALGTTGLGWWTQGIIWFAATEIATYAVIWAMRGKAAMKAHHAGNFRIGFYAWLIVMVSVYGPIFGWHVVRAVYDDHENLVATVQQLRAAPKPVCPTCPKCSACPVSSGAQLKILYQSSVLNGQTILSKPDPQNNSFFVEAFHTKNIGDRATDQVTERLYFAEEISPLMLGTGAWERTDTDEPRFPVAFYCCGSIASRIVNPGETWNWPGFAGVWPKNWPAGKPVHAKVKFFFGGSKPSIASFRISMKSE